MNHEIIWIYIDKRCGGGDKLIPSRFHIQRWKGEYRSWSKNKNSWKKEKANKLLNHLWHFRPYVFALIMTDFIIINVFMHFSSVYYFKSALQFIFKRAPVMSVKWNNHIEKKCNVSIFTQAINTGNIYYLLLFHEHWFRKVVIISYRSQSWMMQPNVAKIKLLINFSY